MRRWSALPAVLLLLLSLGAVPAAPAPPPPHRPAEPGDFDGDGHADLAVGAPRRDDRVGGAVLAYRGGGQGVGVRGRVVAPMLIFHLLASGDFDGDGYADLAVARPADTRRGKDEILVLPGSRRGVTGQGGRALVAERDGPPDFGRAMAVGDFDADGYADLAVADENQVRVCYGSREGLSWNRSVTLSDGERFGYSLASGDVTGDGVADLVVVRNAQVQEEDYEDPAELQEGRLYVVPGRRDAGLRLRDAWSTRLYAPDFGDRRLAVGDVDGDRRADVVTVLSEDDDGPVTELFRSRGRSLAPPKTISRDDDQAALGDVTGDGLADLVTVHDRRPGPPTIDIRAGAPGGLALGPRVLQAPEFASIHLDEDDQAPLPLQLTLLNLTGDHRLEIVAGIARQKRGSVLIFRTGAEGHQTLEGPPETAFGLALTHLSGTPAYEGG